MPIRSDTDLITFEGWTLRARPAETKPASLLLLIHGWTGDENSMWVFARRLPPSYWVIAPRAPHTAEPSGYSWRPPQPSAFGRPSLETMKPAADALISLVDAYSLSVGVDAGQFDVMGFSQGGAMTAVLSLLYPQRVRKVGILSGFVPGGMESQIEKGPLNGKKVFVAHGTLDELVPVDRARASVQLLEQAGAQIQYCEDEVGHKVSADCLRALEAYMAG